MKDLYIGIMSGTSLDGADAVLADFSGSRPVQLAHAHRPFESPLRAKMATLCTPGNDEIHRSQCAAIELGRLYSELISDVLGIAGLSKTDIQAAGCHGQTIRHMPAQGYSLQLNAPALIAELSGVRVVADFRVRDIAAGGQGAPLVPAFHASVFNDDRLSRAVLNLGGMSNVTLLAPGQCVRGFDCGPGNVLMDCWIQHNRQLAFDADGAWAATGVVQPKLLQRLKGHPFFSLAPPKSCGREQFNLEWLLALLPSEFDAADIQATLAELTAQTVADALAASGFQADEIAVCGGGAFNAHLMERLTATTGARVLSTSNWGIAPDVVEAMAFAWLARCTLNGLPGNLPDVTGSRGSRILGAIWPA